MSRILVVDDEAGVRHILGVVLRGGGHEVIEARGAVEARKTLAEERFDLIVTDQQMPDGDGLSLLASAHEVDPNLPVIFITAYATLELAVDAMRKGAFDVLAKPFEPETVLAAAARACERTALLRENEALRGAVRRIAAGTRLLGDGPLMTMMREMITRVAATNATVLIVGETGSGKELVARAIHEASRRAREPFLAINCAAFTEGLLESELFGHERGAFTGADRMRQGLFEAAHGGTLFLDEAGEMTPMLQAKLLRVLVEGEIVRVGSTQPRRVNVRILAATHRDLEQRMREGTFRADLYYRIAVFPINVPALRDHPEDIPLLVAHFLEQCARDLGIPVPRIRTEALGLLEGYSFPGNVRELRNLIERACILAGPDGIGPELFPVHAAAGGAPATSSRSMDQDPGCAGESTTRGSCEQLLVEGTGLRDAVDAYERRMLVCALREADGVQAEAARRLGISRSHMAYKLRKHRLGEDLGGV